MKGLFLARKSPQALLKTLGLDKKKEDDQAVILFTSGTESLPKAVPLSHKNLLSDIRSAFSLVKFYPDDILYGVLPPFHSFGFSVTGVMPSLLGLKIFYAPDPTDAHGMANDIMHWKPTLFCCAPSFTKVLFRVAEPKMLQSIRLFITGAEKTPPELFDYVKKLGPNKILIEGYGITECGPIVTLDRPEKPPKGVGEPIPGVELCVIDESLKILPQGKEGEICIRGPNVFNGYLGKSPNPFIEIQEKKWYRSGDRGHIDSDGALILSGRLKRFIKIGGEMVSLAGLEEELVKLSVQKKWVAGMDKGPALAISVKDSIHNF
jgi:long-chain-fatty-acid--[acyl-carrier-protein] ligase